MAESASEAIENECKLAESPRHGAWAMESKVAEAVELTEVAATPDRVDL